MIINNTFEGKKEFEVYPVTAELAGHFTYKFALNKKAKPYILFGPVCRTPLSGLRNINYATKRTDYAFDLGIGLDKKMTYFNISPELRYSYGLTNLSPRQGGQLSFHTITLVMIFKG